MSPGVFAGGTPASERSPKLPSAGRREGPGCLSPVSPCLGWAAVIGYHGRGRNGRCVPHGSGGRKPDTTVPCGRVLARTLLLVMSPRGFLGVPVGGVLCLSPS